MADENPKDEEQTRQDTNVQGQDNESDESSSTDDETVDHRPKPSADTQEIEEGETEEEVMVRDSESASAKKKTKPQTTSKSEQDFLGRLGERSTNPFRTGNFRRPRSAQQQQSRSWPHISPPPPSEVPMFMSERSQESFTKLVEKCERDTDSAFTDDFPKETYTSGLAVDDSAFRDALVKMARSMPIENIHDPHMVRQEKYSQRRKLSDAIESLLTLKADSDRKVQYLMTKVKIQQEALKAQFMGPARVHTADNKPTPVDLMPQDEMPEDNDFKERKGDTAARQATPDDEEHKEDLSNDGEDTDTEGDTETKTSDDSEKEPEKKFQFTSSQAPQKAASPEKTSLNTSSIADSGISSGGSQQQTDISETKRPVDTTTSESERTSATSAEDKEVEKIMNRGQSTDDPQKASQSSRSARPLVQPSAAKYRCPQQRGEKYKASGSEVKRSDALRNWVPTDRSFRRSLGKQTKSSSTGYLTCASMGIYPPKDVDLSPSTGLLDKLREKMFVGDIRDSRKGDSWRHQDSRSGDSSDRSWRPGPKKDNKPDEKKKDKDKDKEDVKKKPLCIGDYEFLPEPQYMNPCMLFNIRRYFQSIQDIPE